MATHCLNCKKEMGVMDIKCPHCGFCYVEDVEEQEEPLKFFEISFVKKFRLAQLFLFIILMTVKYFTTIDFGEILGLGLALAMFIPFSWLFLRFFCQYYYSGQADLRQSSLSQLANGAMLSGSRINEILKEKDQPFSFWVVTVMVMGVYLWLGFVMPILFTFYMK